MARARSATSAPVQILNRLSAEYRAPFLGVSPAERARRTHLYMNEVLARSGAGEVTVRKEAQGQMLMLDGEMALILTPEDVDVASGATLDSTVAEAKRQLQGVIGIDMLENRRVLIDFRNESMQILETRKRARPIIHDEDAIVVTARNSAGRLILSDARLGGRRPGT